MISIEQYISKEEERKLNNVKTKVSKITVFFNCIENILQPAVDALLKTRNRKKD